LRAKIRNNLTRPSLLQSKSSLRIRSLLPPRQNKRNTTMMKRMEKMIHGLTRRRNLNPPKTSQQLPHPSQLQINRKMLKLIRRTHLIRT
jgi:hypothetical protein